MLTFKLPEIWLKSLTFHEGIRLLPEAFSTQVGPDGQATATIEVENGAIVLRQPAKTVRKGWAQAAAVVSAKGTDAVLMGEFRNSEDKELDW